MGYDPGVEDGMQRTANFWQLMIHLLEFSRYPKSWRRERLKKELMRAWKAYSTSPLRFPDDRTELRRMALEWRYYSSFVSYGYGDSDLKPFRGILRVKNACPCPHHIEEHCVIYNLYTNKEEWIGNECVRRFKWAGHDVETYGIPQYLERARAGDLISMKPETAAQLWRTGAITQDDREFMGRVYRKRNLSVADIARRREIHDKALAAMGFKGIWK